MRCEDFENFNCPMYWRETAEGTRCVALFPRAQSCASAAGVCEAPSWYKGGCPHNMLVGADSRFRQDTPQNCPGQLKKNIAPMSEKIACRLLELKVTTFNKACRDYLSCRFQMRLHGLDFAKPIFKDMVSRCDVQWPCRDQCAQDFATACPTVRLRAVST